MSIRCPTCSRAIEWSAAFPWRPFCSERCKLVDLGAWLAEERAIPGREVDPMDPQTARSPPSAER